MTMLMRTAALLHTIKPAKILNISAINISTNHSLNCKSQSCSRNSPRIFSGIQPTGIIHLGNYLGAISQWKKRQDENENVILEIADLHSITIPQNPETLRQSILQMLATLLACGISPEKVLLFQQSMVSTHAELSWILGCVCTMPRLAHLPTFKEKSASLKDVPLGLYIYPILQAADILSYKATHVPVGEDQSQHIQLTQELAKMFNKRYGYCFPIPRAIVTDNVYARLKSLRDPAKKMSKSDPDPKSRISLLDKPEEVIIKIKKAVTDFTSEISYDPEHRPGVSNLLSIHSFMSSKSIDVICKEVQGLNTVSYKKLLADVIVAHLHPIQKEYYAFLSDEEYLHNILKHGAEEALAISTKTLDEVKEKLGLKYSGTIKTRVASND